MTYQTLMYKTVTSQSEKGVQQIVDRILSSGRMSRQDHNLLTSTVLANGNINDGDRRQINRIFDHLQTGRLKLLDW
ncbi:hypothetical protein H6G33_00535 [Calothrix sp. FACHB-1219]|uniref:hypothetical protein n=1 Tax=unclassified Calothrix TaxID=2619626 RepID=UPI001687E7F3|nr:MULTISPECIES: hypothetical protein [unclassified Calothrix]MBD2201088.1 hypothetical protein [Calothrix sp. FACHB-168]MBD2215521.1 hypothetical protein [Calothrix sp. FACHB-1219]